MEAHMADALVIGAGVGGLSAAIGLAARGLRVDMLEAAERPGGKLGIQTVEGVEVDTGPSVLTLPETLDRTLRLAGTSLRDEIELLEPEPNFRYVYPDGVVLDIHPRIERTLQSVGQTLGTSAAEELGSFLAYARRIWEAAAPHYVFGPAPSVAALLGAGAWAGLVRIDPLRTMWGVIRRRIRSEHLRILLARYATYNGSDVRRAPATLSCIAHVELALGGYGVRGGMYEIARALVRAAEHVGVRIHYGATVRKIIVSDGQVAGVELADGSTKPARVVVGNADAMHVLDELLAAETRARRIAAGEPSMSGWTAVLRSCRRTGNHRRAAHTVLFPRDYMQEFTDIFDRDRPPREPAVYLCAQEACHGRAGWPSDEPVFLMANAPAEPARSRPPEGWRELRQTVRARIEAAGLAEPGDRIVFERTPSDLAREFPGSRGSIYGTASNGPLAAFRRPPNRVRSVPGLYLASGSAHPGGGVPLCILSGQAAARAVLRDRGLDSLGTDAGS
jgi:phytoene desaturase